MQVISAEGMGKGNIDRDNESEQGKLRAANALMDLTFTKEYIKLATHVAIEVPSTHESR